MKDCQLCNCCNRKFCRRTLNLRFWKILSYIDLDLDRYGMVSHGSNLLHTQQLDIRHTLSDSRSYSVLIESPFCS